ncbi:MAG: sugar ABC transporter ATP-binding protein [Anaerolineaceae bacterium]
MTVVLKAENIVKSFPGVLAVDHVSLELEKGEILALVGENGAGKSTLTQILGGAIRPDSGRILLEDRPLSFNSSANAIDAGIAMVFQELSLVGSLSVAENIFANRQPVGAGNFVRWGDLYKQTENFLKRFNLDLDPRRLVKYLSMGQQQILEILKAISTNPKVLILDEPTSSLTESETKFLFSNIRRLQTEGMSFIYITHKLFEVFQIASRVAVMRDGKYIGTRGVTEVSESDLVAMMVGRKISNLYGKSEKTSKANDKEAFFRVEGLASRGLFKDISFEMQRGEILGLAGLVGARRTEIGRAIFGVDRLDAGRIILNGKEVHIRNPQQAIQHKIAYLTEDRKNLGLFLSMSVRDNVVAPALKDYTTTAGFLDRGRLGRYAHEKMTEFTIDSPSVSKKVLQLSGGNQQKCLVAMWMSIDPQVIIFDEPTRGVDVGARAEIYQKLREFAVNGAGILMISSDMPELIGMCDRILVIHHGCISGELKKEDFDEKLILSYAAGLQDCADKMRTL